MGRPNNLWIREAFECTGNEAKCINCGKVLIGVYVGNMKRHLSVEHQHLFNQMKMSFEGNEAANDRSPSKKRKITVEMSVDDVKDACLDIVTTEGKPLLILDSIPFKTSIRFLKLLI